MRHYSKISSRFWTGETGKKIRRLDADAKVIALYLMTNPHASMLGIYYLPIAYISQDTGTPLEGTCKGLQSLCELDFCSYDPDSEYVWVHNMAFYQIGSMLDPKDKRVKGIQNACANLPKLPFLKAFFEKYANDFHLKNYHKNMDFSEAPCKPLRSQEQEQEQEQDKRLSMSSNTLLDVDGLQETFAVNHSPPTARPIATKTTNPALKQQAAEILQFLNQRANRQYRPVDTNLKLITARLKSGATPLQCRQVIIRKHREWKDDAKMVEYLRPATLFNATKFEQYVGELVVEYEAGDSHET